MRAEEMACGMLHQQICPYEQRRAQSSAQSTHKVT